MSETMEEHLSSKLLHPITCTHAYYLRWRLVSLLLPPGHALPTSMPDVLPLPLAPGHALPRSMPDVLPLPLPPGHAFLRSTPDVLADYGSRSS